MGKQTKPKTKRTETLTWKNCLFVGMEWEKCNVNGNSVFNAIFLTHDKTMVKFRLWGYSTAHDVLDKINPLTPCILKSHWCRDWKWLETVEIEGGKNDN